MNSKDDSSKLNDELVLKQVYEIFDILKNIKKDVRCKFLKSEKQYGFTVHQLSVIFHLNAKPLITLNELSDFMGLTKSTVSGIVDRLAKQGIVTREIPKDNRRIVKLSISEEFKNNNDISDMKNKILSDLVSDYTNYINKIDPEDVEKMIYGLRQFSLLLKNNNCD